MKKIVCTVIALLLVLIAINVFAAPPSDLYQLTFSDEFDGEALNTDIWAYRTNTKTGGVNKPENVRVEDGTLYIDYKKEGDTYTSGGVISKISFPYGYYETRAKIYGGTGALHSSFWIHGFGESTEADADIPKHSNTVEIDAFEINSHDSTRLSYGTYYNWAGSTSRFRQSYDVQDWSADYFVMGFEWLPDRVNFYVDGKLIGTDEDFGVYGPSHMWLTALAQPEGREHLIDDSLLPGFSEFDYYRFYQMPIKGLNLLGNGGFEYDRISNDEYPRCFVVKGTDGAVRNITSLDAYEGYQSMIIGKEDAYDVFTGQKFTCIVPGKYTYSGMFKGGANISNARMVVYDRDNNVIAEKNIPETSDWTKVTIENIDVDGFAYVAIECEDEGETSLLVDNLEFFIQDGVEYNETTKPDFLEYNYVNSSIINKLYNKYILDIEDASAITGEWVKSSLKSGSFFAYYNEDNSLEWEFTAERTAEHSLEVYRLPESANMKQQIYTVYVNDDAGTEFVVETKNVEEGWFEAGRINLTKGDKVRIKLTSGATSGFIRFYQLCMVESEIKDMHYTPVFMIDNPCVYYKGKLFFENSEGDVINVYEQDGEYYFPYKLINEVIGLNLPVDESTESVSVTEIEQNSDYDVIYDKGFIYFVKKDTEISEYTKCFIYCDFLTAMDVEKSSWAKYVGTETDAGEKTYGVNEAIKSGTWQKSNVGGGNYYNSGNNRVLWYDLVPEKGRYKLQYNSVVHTNTTTKAWLAVYAGSDKQRYCINQKTGVAGWYDLGTYELEPGIPFSVIFGADNNGYIRIKDLRLIALPDGISATQNGKTVNITVAKFPASTVGKIILAEYCEDGSFLKAHIKDAAANTTFELSDANNFYKIMLWKSFETMQPLCVQTAK